MKGVARCGVIDNDLSVLYCFVSADQEKSIDNMQNLLAYIVSKAVSGEVAEEKIKELHKECEKFPEEVIEKLRKKIKI